MRHNTYHLHGSGVGSQTEMIAHDHSVTMDLPAMMGGSDKGMQPVELFLASLCGCEQATALFIARNMNPRVYIEKIEFDVFGERDNKGAISLPINLESDAYPPAMLTRIWGQAKVYTSATSSELEFIAKEVKRRCPIAGMVIAAGCNLEISYEKAADASSSDDEDTCDLGAGNS